MATLEEIDALCDQKRYLKELDLHITQLSQQLNSSININYKDIFKHISEYVHETNQDTCLTNVSEPGQNWSEICVFKEEIIAKISEIKSRITKIHLEALNQVLLNSIPSANEILSLHTVLKRGFATIIERCNTTGNLEVLTLKINCIREVNSLLDTQYESHVNSSSSKLKLAIAKANNKYKELMKNSMDVKPWPYRELQKFHSDCSEEAIKEFRLALQCFEIEKDVGNSEIDMVEMTAQQFEIFIDENDDRIRELINNPKSILMEINRSSVFSNEKIEDPPVKEKDICEKQNPDGPNVEIQPTQSKDFCEKSNTDKPSEVTIAIEFGLSKIKVATWLNGNFQLIPTFVDNEDFPLRVAFSRRGNMAVFGSEIDKQETQEPIFSITELMLTPTDEFVSSTSVMIRGYHSNFQPTKEFIFGLLLAKLKKEAETFLKCRVTGAIITVPLWYTISQRQSTMDSGKIAGFSTVDLINEHTAIAVSLAFHNQLSPTPNAFSETYNPFYIMIVNKYRYDIAKFSFSNKHLTLNRSSGNLHKSIGGLFNRPKNWFKMPFQDLLSKDACDDVKTYLLEDVRYNGGLGVTSTDLLYLVCDSEEQKKDNLNIMNKKHFPFFLQPEISNATILGAVRFSEFLNSSFLKISKIQESHVYQVESFDYHCSSQTAIFTRNSDASMSRPLLLQPGYNLVYNIYENGIVSSFKLGELKVLRKPANRYANAHFVLDIDGRLKVYAKYVDFEEEVPSVWTPVNLNDEAVSFYASIVKCYSQLIM